LHLKEIDNPKATFRIHARQDATAKPAQETLGPSKHAQGNEN
jgi:hypothetical protein